MFYQMLFGKYPYVGINDHDILRKIKKSQPDFTGIDLSKSARQFLSACLTANPKERISWLEIYKHPLIIKGSGFLYGSLKSSKLNVKGN